MQRALLAVYTVLILATMVWAHGGEQHVMGTVTKIDAMSMSVKTTDGAAKTVMVMPETTFVKNGSTIKLRDLKVGDRVVIHAKAIGDMLHATEVKIGADVNTQEIHFELSKTAIVFVETAEKRRELSHRAWTHIENRRGPRSASELVKTGRMEMAVHCLDIRRNVAQAQDAIHQQLRTLAMNQIRNGAYRVDLAKQYDLTDHDRV